MRQTKLCWNVCPLQTFNVFLQRHMGHTNAFPFGRLVTYSKHQTWLKLLAHDKKDWVGLPELQRQREQI
jgi:hypothetical protein